MIKQARSLYGYRELLVYKKAEDLQSALANFVSHFPPSTSSGQAPSKTLLALADQMERSARSTKQNITEGWKRNSTGEYYQFLGYAIASNAELEEDFTDICKGLYEQKGLKGLDKGVEKGEENGEEREEREKWGQKGGEKEGARGKDWGWIESVPFYPLNPFLPICLQLKLRAKELNYLLDKLQKSLTDKMGSEGTLSVADKLKKQKDRRKDEDEWFKKSLEEQGSVRLENGQIVERGKWEKGEVGNGFAEWDWDR